jgi:hypothetical protein
MKRMRSLFPYLAFLLLAACCCAQSAPTVQRVTLPTVDWLTLAGPAVPAVQFVELPKPPIAPSPPVAQYIEMPPPSYDWYPHPPAVVRVEMSKPAERSVEVAASK